VPIRQRDGSRGARFIYWIILEPALVAIKIIQIGAGIRGRHWAQFIAAHPDVECVGFVEPAQESVKLLKGIVGDQAPCFPDIDTALRAVKPDAALVVTPSATHATVTLRCLDAGLTVMVEKPLAPSVAEGRQVLARARAVGKQVIVAENYRFWPAERTILRLLRESFLGRLDNAVMIDRRKQPSSVEGPWFGQIEYPQLQEIATHHFDSLRGFFGAQPKSITVRTWNPAWTDYRHGAHTEAFIDFDNVHVQYVGTLLSQRYGFSLWIEGERGVLWTNRKLVAFRPGGSRWFRPMRNDKVPKGDERPYPQGGTTSLLNSLRDAVLHGTTAETRGDDNIWTVAMVDAGKISDRERRTVDLSEVYSGEPAAAAR
jgi:predicted dehydrogenase